MFDGHGLRASVASLGRRKCNFLDILALPLGALHQTLINVIGAQTLVYGKNTN